MHGKPTQFVTGSVKWVDSYASGSVLMMCSPHNMARLHPVGIADVEPTSVVLEIQNMPGIDFREGSPFELIDYVAPRTLKVVAAGKFTRKH